jgi:aminopeptidase N
MHLDSVSFSHPISVEVNNPDEINEIFDGITYGKVNLFLTLE